MIRSAIDRVIQRGGSFDRRLRRSKRSSPARRRSTRYCWQRHRCWRDARAMGIGPATRSSRRFPAAFSAFAIQMAARRRVQRSIQPADAVTAGRGRRGDISHRCDHAWYLRTAGGRRASWTCGGNSGRARGCHQSPLAAAQAGQSARSAWAASGFIRQRILALGDGAMITNDSGLANAFAGCAGGQSGSIIRRVWRNRVRRSASGDPGVRLPAADLTAKRRRSPRATGKCSRLAVPFRRKPTASCITFSGTDVAAGHVPGTLESARRWNTGPLSDCAARSTRIHERRLVLPRGHPHRGRSVLAAAPSQPVE